MIEPAALFSPNYLIREELVVHTREDTPWLVKRTSYSYIAVYFSCFKTF